MILRTFKTLPFEEPRDPPIEAPPHVFRAKKGLFMIQIIIHSVIGTVSKLVKPYSCTQEESVKRKTAGTEKENLSMLHDMHSLD